MSDTPKTEPLADEELQEATGGAAISTNAFGATLIGGVDEDNTGQTQCIDTPGGEQCRE